MFAEWLIEAYYLRTSIQLSHIPHYTTLQKFAATISGTVLGRIISSFILLLGNIRRLFIGMDSSGFKITHASQYYTERTGLGRKYVVRGLLNLSVLFDVENITMLAFTVCVFLILVVVNSPLSIIVSKPSWSFIGILSISSMMIISL